LALSGETAERILVSSSEPSDGKTTISANLAVAYAQAGRKTLVIDADLRKPGMSKLLNLKGKQGVADILSADQSASEAAPTLIVSTDVVGLDILPVGMRRSNPAELLSSANFAELLAWADSQYDQVLIDCPPVMAVSDAQIVGQLVDGAILVVRPAKNNRRVVIRAVESFHATGCRVLGVVANGVSEKSGGYGYGYGYGYGHEDDDESTQGIDIMEGDQYELPADTYGSVVKGADTISPASQTSSTEPKKIQPRRAA
jgi:succinoglycan biosynthesis transport protein ExoP